eukprot:6201856-Pleurochrysis_carterae.AAC.4
MSCAEFAASLAARSACATLPTRRITTPISSTASMKGALASAFAFYVTLASTPATTESATRDAGTSALPSPPHVESVPPPAA